MHEIHSIKNKQLIPLLRGGKVGVLPTDTVYGLVCDAKNVDAVEHLYRLKSREHKPGVVIAASIDQLVDLGMKARYLKAVEQYWPNPLTVIIPTSFELTYLHRGKGSLAVRIPSDPAVHDLLVQTGPLLTTSANHPGEPEASTITKAKAYFDDEVDFYVDGGDLRDRNPSTIIKVIDDAVEVLRQGAVTIGSGGEITQS
jgi:L-threonylcarbamoyladenylate synthase